MVANTSTETLPLESIVEQLPSEFRAKELNDCPIQLYYQWDSSDNGESQTLRITAARIFFHSVNARTGKEYTEGREVGTITVRLIPFREDDTRYIAHLSFAATEPDLVPQKFPEEFTRVVWESLCEQAPRVGIMTLIVEALPSSPTYELAREMGFKKEPNPNHQYPLSHPLTGLGCAASEDIIPGSRNTYRKEIERPELAWFTELWD